MTRTFIALEMNSELLRQLAGVIGLLAQALPGVRWVDPTGIHLTLAFLGELDDEQLAAATDAAQVAAQQCNAFSYRLTHLGIFGSTRQPRVIWLGIERPSSGALTRLHRTLNRELERRHFEVDQRPFSPHLTLARIKAPFTPAEQASLQDLLAGKRQGLVSPDVYPVRAIHVMKSELLRTGAHYTCLQTCALK